MRHRDDFDDDFGGFFRGFGIMAALTVLLNLAFWGGLIFFTFWCLDYFKVI